MKLIIAGSRTLSQLPSDISEILINIGIDVRNIKEIISGRAKGVDLSGEEFAKANNIKIKEFPANWEMYGKRAGSIRNAKMAKYGDVLLLIWDGASKGSANMKQQMEKLHKPIYEVIK